MAPPADQLTVPCVMRDEADIVGVAPAFDIPRELGPPHDLPRRAALGRVERLIQHLPQDWFIRSCESANHVIHCYGRKRFRHKSTDYLKKYEGVLREYPFGKKKKSKSSIVSLFRINSVLVEPA